MRKIEKSRKWKNKNKTVLNMERERKEAKRNSDWLKVNMKSTLFLTNEPESFTHRYNAELPSCKNENAENEAKNIWDFFYAR